MNTKSRSILVASLFALAVLLSVHISKTAASVTDGATGYSWAANFGLIRANNCSDITDPTTCGSASYGLNIPKTGTTATGSVTGYTWSPNIGWIAFNSESVGGGSQKRDDGSTFTPTAPVVDFDHKNGDGSTPIKGWARACSVFASGCSGALKDNAYRGNWDGYIALSDSKTGDAASWGVNLSADSNTTSGFAWGGDVLGWMTMNFAVKDVPINNCPNGQIKTNQGCVDTEFMPTIAYFFPKECIATATAKPAFTWESEQALQCKITRVVGGQNEIVATSARIATPHVLGGDGYYYHTTTVAANGDGTQYALTCINGYGVSDPMTATVSLCSGNGGTSEKQCANGIDDDGDGLIDFSTTSTGRVRLGVASSVAIDPGCLSATDDNEKNVKPIYIEQ